MLNNYFLFYLIFCTKYICVADRALQNYLWKIHCISYLRDSPLPLNTYFFFSSIYVKYWAEMSVFPETAPPDVERSYNPACLVNATVVRAMANQSDSHLAGVKPSMMGTRVV